LDETRRRLALGEDAVDDPVKDGTPVCDRSVPPLGGGRAGPVDRVVDIRLRRRRELCVRLARDCRLDRDRVGVTRGELVV